MNEPSSPVDWLWRQLTTLLPADQFAALREGYTAQTQRHKRYTKLKQAVSELVRFEQMRRAASSERWAKSFDRRIANRKVTIARLESEIANDRTT